jgi:hypothetical protein
MTGTQQYCDSGAFLPSPQSMFLNFEVQMRKLTRRFVEPDWACSGTPIHRTRSVFTVADGTPRAFARNSNSCLHQCLEMALFTTRRNFLVPRNIKAPDRPWRNLFRLVSLAIGRIILTCRYWAVIELTARRKLGTQAGDRQQQGCCYEFLTHTSRESKVLIFLPEALWQCLQLSPAFLLPCLLQSGNANRPPDHAGR